MENIRYIPGYLILLFLLLAGCSARKPVSECDRFVAWVAPAKDAYFEAHQVYPASEDIQNLAIRYMPRLWVHPKSWRPISFEEYLGQSKLVRKSDGKVLMVAPSAKDIAMLSQEEQCNAYLEAADVAPSSPAPRFTFRSSMIEVRPIQRIPGPTSSIIRSLIGVGWRGGLAGWVISGPY